MHHKNLKKKIPNIANKVMRSNLHPLFFGYKEGPKEISNYIFGQIFVMIEDMIRHTSWVMDDHNSENVMFAMTRFYYARTAE